MLELGQVLEASKVETIVVVVAQSLSPVHSSTTIDYSNREGVDTKSGVPKRDERRTVCKWSIGVLCRIVQDENKIGHDEDGRIDPPMWVVLEEVVDRHISCFSLNHVALKELTGIRGDRKGGGNKYWIEIELFVK
jgi:hypothetical protein